MYLVLCDLDDIAAIWLFQGLRNKGLQIELITSEMLAYSLIWEHELREEKVITNFKLADGRKINSENIKGVINRIQKIPTKHLKSNSEDKEYAIQEIFAFFLSWIYSLPCPVFNRPTPQGLSGRWRHASEWVMLAHLSRLPTPVYRQTSFEEIKPFSLNGKLVPYVTPISTVFALNGHAIGPEVLKKMNNNCLRLAETSKTPFLGIEFMNGASGNWIFTGATPMLDFRLGKHQLLETIKDVLLEGRELYQ